MTTKHTNETKGQLRRLDRRVRRLSEHSSECATNSSYLQPNAGSRNVRTMSIEALKEEVKGLPIADRRKLMAFMVVLEDQSRADYASKLTQKIDDKSSGRWLTAEQCERDLGLPDDSK